MTSNKALIYAVDEHKNHRLINSISKVNFGETFVITDKDGWIDCVTSIECPLPMYTRCEVRLFTGKVRVQTVDPSNLHEWRSLISGYRLDHPDSSPRDCLDDEPVEAHNLSSDEPIPSRGEVAMRMMQSLSQGSNFSYIRESKEMFAELAVDLADALIEELSKEKK